MRCTTLAIPFRWGVAWYLQKVSARRSDRFYSYGYKRFSLIGAIFISVVLLAGSVVVIKECIGRILEPQMPDAAGMFVLAILGIIVNGAAVIRLKRDRRLTNGRFSPHDGGCAGLGCRAYRKYRDAFCGMAYSGSAAFYRNKYLDSYQCELKPEGYLPYFASKVPSDVDIERPEEEIRNYRPGVVYS